LINEDDARQKRRGCTVWRCLHFSREYMVTHEPAHATTKQHTKNFWKTVKLIYPNYEAAKKLLTEHSCEDVTKLKNLSTGEGRL